MARAITDGSTNPGQPTSQWGPRLTSAAFVLLLCCVAGRCFVQELQFRLSPLRTVLSPVPGADAGRAPVVSAEEVARVTYAILLLAAGALAAAGAALSGRLVVRRTWLAELVVFFSAAALVSAIQAADKRSGLLVWLEQSALVSACFAAAQLCGDHGRQRTLLSVLLALGIAMAATGLWQHFAGAVDQEDFFKLRAGSQASASRSAGADPGGASRTAEMLEQRLSEDTPTGYLGLANTFASLLILVLSAAAGVAADAVRLAVLAGRQGKRARGEIPALPVAAGAAVAACLAILLTLALTRSRAGIVCAALALIAGAMIGLFRERLARHWKKAVAATILAGALLGAGVTAYGLKYDALPGKSMTFRWFYWTASARIIGEHPAWGVGGGNFSDAYLRARRAEAEEEVRDPHNFILHALTQFGLAGGVPYLAILAAVLVCLARPVLRMGETPMPGAMPFPVRGEGHVPTPHAHPSPGDKLRTAYEHGTHQSTFWVGSAVTLAVLLSRVAFGDLGLDAGALVVEAVWPTAIFAVAMFLAASIVGMTEAAPIEGGWTRIALAVGAAAFVLHNLTEFGLWTPGVALVFWVGAGAGLAQCAGGREWDLSRFRWPLAAAAIAAVAAVGVFLWRPTLLKTLDAQQAADLWHDGQTAEAAGAAVRAAEVDVLDDLAASDAARMIVASTPTAPAPAAGHFLARADHWAQQALERDPAACANWQIAATIAWYRAVPDSFHYARRAAGKDPDIVERELMGRLKERQPVEPELGHLEYARGQFAQAARFFTKALERDPNSSFLRGCLGDSLWRDGNREGALAAWREAEARFPDRIGVISALNRMERAVVYNPADAHFHLGFARMLCEAGNYDKCLAELAKAEEIDRRLIAFAQKYPPPSKTIFSAEDRAQAEMLKARSEAGRR